MATPPAREDAVEATPWWACSARAPSRQGRRGWAAQGRRGRVAASGRGPAVR